MKKLIRLLIISLAFILFLVLCHSIYASNSIDVNITVPSSIDVVMNEDGTNTVSDFYVQNDMIVSAQINDITVNGMNGWGLVSKGDTIPLDTKSISLSLGGNDLVSGSNSVKIDLPEGKRTDLDVDISRGAFSSDINETAFSLEIGYSLGFKDFTLSFDSNGGGAVSSIVAKNGSNAVLPSTVRTGYTLEGWKDTLGVCIMVVRVWYPLIYLG